MSERLRYEVLVSERARDMLFDHARFLAAVSMDATEKLFDRFDEKVTTLEEMPERCSLYINPYLHPREYRRLDLGYHLLILFRIVEDKVLIELVVDTRSRRHERA